MKQIMSPIGDNMSERETESEEKIIKLKKWKEIDEGKTSDTQTATDRLPMLEHFVDKLKAIFFVSLILSILGLFGLIACLVLYPPFRLTIALSLPFCIIEILVLHWLITD